MMQRQAELQDIIDAPLIRKVIDGDDSQVAQLVDLCLLQNGLLKGEALQRFVERTMSSL